MNDAKGRVAVVASMLLLTALIACKKDGGGRAGSACSGDSDCKNGFLCESGACMPEEAAKKIRSGGSGSSAAASGCAKAVACCKAVSTKSGSAATANCDNYAAMGESVCAGVLENWTRAGKSVGVDCSGDLSAAAPIAPAAPGEPAPAAAHAPAAADDGPIPAIPSGRSDPPSSSEWASAREVNTQAASSRPDGCTLKVVREWLQVNCWGSNVVGYEKMENFGRKNLDYFESVVPGKVASFVVRLKKGGTQAIRICRQKDRASLFVNWPSSKDRPVHVALGKGPACDGSGWGESQTAQKYEDRPPCDEACPEGRMAQACTKKGSSAGCPKGYTCNIYGHSDGEQNYEELMCFCSTPCRE